MRGRHHVILTVLDEQIKDGNGADVYNLKPFAKGMSEEELELRKVWLKRLDEAISLSSGEELPDFQRPTFMRKPVNLTDQGERS
jgi:hypothetical protein